MILIYMEGKFIDLSDLILDGLHWPPLEQILKCPLLTYAGRRVGLVLVTRSHSVIVCVPGAVIVAPGVALAPAAPGAALAVVTLEATNSLALVLPPFK